MQDYKKLYFELYKKITDVILDLTMAQRQIVIEEEYDDEEKIKIESKKG